MTTRQLMLTPVIVIAAMALATPVPQTSVPAQASTAAAACDPGNGGITLPDGFCATVFADGTGHARHVAVAPNGDVYVNTHSNKNSGFTNAPGGFIVAMRDADRDGRAEIVERFGTTHQAGKPGGGSGIAIHDNALYVEVDDRIVRYPLDGKRLVPAGEPQIVLSGLPMEGDHTSHTFTIAPDGTMYVNSGSMTNSCQVQNRALESPGQKPCRELSLHAGIWRYDAKKSDQAFSTRERIVTGARNTLALTVAADGALYGVIHGRDQLSENWPKLYTPEENDQTPAELLARLEPGQDYGWPYCYYDGSQERAVLAPEYGGDGGNEQGDCATRTAPVAAFPAHWSPEAIVFYSGTAFPESHWAGAFISFHGSWNRTPPQQGFRVVFVPFTGKTAGPHKDFATQFTGDTLPADSKDPAQAPHRPMGLAVGPDGALYITDDVKGRVWKVVAKN